MFRRHVPPFLCVGQSMPSGDHPHRTPQRYHQMRTDPKFTSHPSSHQCPCYQPSHLGIKVVSAPSSPCIQIVFWNNHFLRWGRQFFFHLQHGSNRSSICSSGIADQVTGTSGQPDAETVQLAHADSYKWRPEHRTQSAWLWQPQGSLLALVFEDTCQLHMAGMVAS